MTSWFDSASKMHCTSEYMRTSASMQGRHPVGDQGSFGDSGDHSGKIAPCDAAITSINCLQVVLLSPWIAGKSTMRSRKIVSVFCIGAALGLGASAGCGGGRGRSKPTLADVPPPPPGASVPAKAQPLPSAPPKFGSPPRSEMGPHANPGS